MSKPIVSKNEANFERQGRLVSRELGEPQKIIVLFRIDTAFQTSACIRLRTVKICLIYLQFTLIRGCSSIKMSIKHSGGKVKLAIQTIGYNKNWPSDPLKDTSIQPYLFGIRKNFILSKSMALFEIGLDANSKQHPVTPESYGLISETYWKSVRTRLIKDRGKSTLYVNFICKSLKNKYSDKLTKKFMWIFSLNIVAGSSIR
ncbi:hypothetical protein EGR_10192 [Echinococcus granulosus]|uniref:Uncharacterized protein n=1 Tax=Echinococcus granulosus TaxID=6210 RepID=W6U8Y7_ECHGR|nr:hypothetical protein EGR_10192 [Echinococcus granulosus]EUB54957.1 hypothetical protein EGR_10192 [Echinococcus granulosus]